VKPEVIPLSDTKLKVKARKFVVVNFADPRTKIKSLLLIFNILPVQSFYSLTADAYRQSCVLSKPIPVAVRSKELVGGHLIVGIAGSNPAEGVDVLLLYMLYGCVGSGLCDGLINRPEESYRVCVCVCVCEI
jgi:hypothetical protein